MTEHAQEQAPAPKPGKSDASAIRDEVKVRLVRADTAKENTNG